MDLEGQVREAIVAELQRQAEAHEGDLQVTPGDRAVTVNGKVDLDELTMAVVGSVAGGP